MVLLEDLSEGALLHTLRLRYEKSLIYTYISTILVALNPYQRLKIYGDDVMTGYCRSDLSDPHPYALARNAYESLSAKQGDQAVIISGECA